MPNPERKPASADPKNDGLRRGFLRIGAIRRPSNRGNVALATMGIVMGVLATAPMAAAQSALGPWLDEDSPLGSLPLNLDDCFAHIPSFIINPDCMCQTTLDGRETICVYAFASIFQKCYAWEPDNCGRYVHVVGGGAAAWTGSDLWGVMAGTGPMNSFVPYQYWLCPAAPGVLRDSCIPSLGTALDACEDTPQGYEGDCWRIGLHAGASLPYCMPVRSVMAAYSVGGDSVYVDAEANC